MTFDKSQMSYVSLRNIVAERTNGIVFWIGSGLSADAGLPVWADFKEELLKVIGDKIAQLESPDNTHHRGVMRVIGSENNSWRAFEKLKTEVGHTTWRSRIRELLRPSASADSPQVYRKLWQLEPSGILTLNLDRLATKAFMEVNTGRVVTEFVGSEVADYAHVLKNPNPFICHLHGELDNASSWVLTSSDLRQLQDDVRYLDFIKSCLMTKTIVFIGISADDAGVGGLIEQLYHLNIDVDAHYWITHRRDVETDRWAEERGIRLIRYEAGEEDHSSLLEMLDDLIAFVSRDDPNDAAPVIPLGMTPTDGIVPSQAALLRMDKECIREILNQEANRILSSGSEDSMELYTRFTQTYDEAIYSAWYTNPESDSNYLLSHVLHEEVASGAFGKVFRATDPQGQDVAVKVLHGEIRQDIDLFQAFRRGVHSMRILGSHDVPGMVPYKNAFEIPAFVVMDWVDGPNLDDAVLSTHIDEWHLILRIGSDMADIIRRGHVLPERVLHRDIRPSNVMLRRFYSNPDHWDVVVLDFDLSWHRGALARSVIHGSAMLGYLAPEQIQDIAGVSTRHAAVDSFGFGMVLFFMMSQRNPVPDEHKHTDWNDTLVQAATERPCAQWQSVPKRFARLIQSATQHNQAERWDMTQIQAELQRLHRTVLQPEVTQSVELVAEEIAARCEFSRDYEWNSDTLAAIKGTPSGVRLELVGDESQRLVYANLNSGSSGVQGRAHLSKWIGPAMETARDILDSFGWQIEDSSFLYAHISISASLPVETALDDMDGTVESLDRALEPLRRFS